MGDFGAHPFSIISFPCSSLGLLYCLTWSTRNVCPQSCVHARCQIVKIRTTYSRQANLETDLSITLWGLHHLFSTLSASPYILTQTFHWIRPRTGLRFSRVVQLLRTAQNRDGMSISTFRLSLDSWSLVSYDHAWCKLVIIIHVSQDMARPHSAQRSLGLGNRVT